MRVSICRVRHIFLLGLALLGSLPCWGMEFSLHERCYSELTPKCQTMVIAEGSIDKDTVAQFRSFTQTLPAGTWIAFTSPGGSLVAGMQLGSVIRERRFNTTITNTDYAGNSCLSACAYAFLGGLNRLVPSTSRYGLHQFRGTQKELGDADTQKLSAILANYMDRMGVDRRLLDIAQLTSAERVTLLSPAQTKLYRVDNLGQSPLPRWRLETSVEGRLLALNHAMVSKTTIPVVVAFFQTPAGVACLIYYKSDEAQAFQANNRHFMRIEQQRFALSPLSPWQAKSGGYQSNFSIPTAALDALGQLPTTSVMQIEAEFHPPLAGQNTVEMSFGVAGLKNALAVLAQTPALGVAPTAR